MSNVASKPATLKEERGREERAPDFSSQDRANYIRTEFLDRVAHELRGPAGVTLGALDELELALGDQATPHAALIAMARRGVRKVLRTAERLTRTAQLESGNVSFLYTPTDVRGLVQRACSDAEILEGRRGVKLDMTLPSEPCVVALDASWVQLALTEVIAGALRGARKLVTVQLTLAAPRVRIAVSDDGAMTKAPTALRFEPRADRRDAGLSFPLAHEIASAHGGELSLEPADPCGVLAVMSFGGAP